MYNLKSKTKLVVITGAESTGKSILAEGLSRYFGAPYIPEFAREYVEKLGRHYTYDDVERIARMQVQQFNKYLNGGHPVVFADTWLIITKIWFEEVYRKLPFWLDNEIRSAEIDLFLVCDTDLPWVPDRVRENGGEKRIYLQKRYIETIKEYGFSYETISGFNSHRIHNAIRILEQQGIVKPNVK